MHPKLRIKKMFRELFLICMNFFNFLDFFLKIYKTKLLMSEDKILCTVMLKKTEAGNITQLDYGRIILP